MKKHLGIIETDGELINVCDERSICGLNNEGILIVENEEEITCKRCQKMLKDGHCVRN